MTISSKFAEIVEKARRIKGLTQADIARKMKVKQQSAAYYLAGKGLDLDTAKGLAEAVEEDLLEILGTILPQPLNNRAAPAAQSGGLPLTAGPRKELTRKEALIEFILHASPAQIEHLEAVVQSERLLAENQAEMRDTSATPKRRG
jgi:transcriptional regulator with XRE-family HTH domain